MSTPQTATHPAAEDHDDHHDAAHDHPSDAHYVKIALILAAITAVEVFTYFKSVFDFGRTLMPMLIILGAVKFYLIVMHFMHLKFDHKLLRAAFATGLGLALVVYLVALTVFQLFQAGVSPA